MSHPIPLIKGIFINSHIKRLERKQGKEGILLLEKNLGRELKYANLQDYPVREEVELIEHMLDILHPGLANPETRSFEAGRLHFVDFSCTQFGKVILSAYPKTADGFMQLFKQLGTVAKFVFKNSNFTSKALGITRGLAVMENNDYPIDHFRGFFCAMMEYWKLKGISVEENETAPRRYEYTLSWKYDRPAQKIEPRQRG
jgi:uncharacterized protein (TIGR02265 family)